MTSNASNATPSNPFQDAVRSGVRDLSAVWWWFLSLGVAWTLFGTYVLSYRVGSLAAVAALVGVAFLFAPLYHPALRYAGPTRSELGVPTVFNFLGPVANPARPTSQAVGVLTRGWARSWPACWPGAAARPWCSAARTVSTS